MAGLGTITGGNHAEDVKACSGGLQFLFLPLHVACQEAEQEAHGGSQDQTQQAQKRPAQEPFYGIRIHIASSCDYLLSRFLGALREIPSAWSHSTTVTMTS